MRPGRALVASLLAAALILSAGGLASRAAAPLATHMGVAPRPEAAAFLRPKLIPFPADNPYSAAKADLGRALFFDTRLSGGNSYACASCHNPETVWSDGVARGKGEDGGTLPRRTPGILDLAWGERFFWDGRADSLEAQALGPITAPGEMNQPLDALVAELSSDAALATHFRAAFPEAAGEPNPITVPRIAAALATFERTLRSSESPFDRWAAGDDKALDDAAKRGFALFTGPAGCTNCHKGWAFTDHAFHDVGLPSPDKGRGVVLPGVDHAFKTPSLRDVARRAPYMHDGSLATLEAVIEHYASGYVQRPSLSDDLPRLAGLGPGDRADLVAFLRSLNGDAPGGPVPVAMAAHVPPKATPAAPSGDRVVREAVISQKDRTFAPGAVAVTAGGTVTIVNDDTRRHNVRITEPILDVNTGIQKPGEIVHITLPAAGTYTVYCGIHPEMKLTIRAVEPGDSQGNR